MDSLYGGESVPSPMDQVAGQDPAINQPASTGPKRMWRTFSGQSNAAILLQAGQKPEYWIFSVKAEDCVSLDYFQYLQDGETLYLNGPNTQCWGDVITMVIPGNFRNLTLLPLTSVNVAYWAAAVSGYDVGPMGPR